MHGIAGRDGQTIGGTEINLRNDDDAFGYAALLATTGSYNTRPELVAVKLPFWTSRLRNGCSSVIVSNSLSSQLARVVATRSPRLAGMVGNSEV